MESTVGQTETWFDFSDDGLVIGKKGSDQGKFSTKIDNKGLYFMEDSVEVAKIDNQTMHIKEAEIEDQIKMGPLTGIVDATGINWVWNV